nr:ATP synthase F0 subunit 8 [Mantitheus pekinensis]
MPQMAPLNWLILMFFFITVFKLFNCMNYYSFLYQPKTKLLPKIQMKLNWKW